MTVVAPLDSKYEKPPKALLPRGFVPFGGLPHKVRYGENWQTIARLYGMTDVWELIKYNFLTTDPREVNWYLREFVGCRLPTMDLKNWRFSDDDSPGLVYYPPWAPVKPTLPPLPPKPAPPAPPPARIAYTVPGKLPIVVQMSSWQCWSAVGTIMLSWRDKTTYSIEKAMDLAGPIWRARYEDDEGLSTSQMFRFVEACGMTYEGQVCYPGKTWLELLQKRGPVVVVMGSGNDFHGVVLNSMQGDLSATGTSMHYNDPQHNTRRSMKLEDFNAAADEVADSYLPQMWHYGSKL